MKTSRFSDSHIIAVLKQTEAGSPVPAWCREHGISVRLACLAFGISQTYYHYQAKQSAENVEIADPLERALN